MTLKATFFLFSRRDTSGLGDLRLRPARAPIRVRSRQALAVAKPPVAGRAFIVYATLRRPGLLKNCLLPPHRPYVCRQESTPFRAKKPGLLSTARKLEVEQNPVYIEKRSDRRRGPVLKPVVCCCLPAPSRPRQRALPNP